MICRPTWFPAGFADIRPDDSIKVYKIIGKGQVVSFGRTMELEDEDLIII